MKKLFIGMLIFLMVVGMLATGSTSFAGSSERETVFSSKNWKIEKQTDLKDDHVTYSLSAVTDLLQFKYYYFNINNHVDGIRLYLISKCVVDSGTITYRIDKNTPFKFESFNTYHAILTRGDDSIISQMKSGQVLRVFPDLYSSCKLSYITINLNGFDEAYNKLLTFPKNK